MRTWQTTCAAVIIRFTLYAHNVDIAHAADELPIHVTVIGIINDGKFTMEGKGQIDPETGDANVELRYSSIPKGWNALNYSDPLVLLAGYGESDGGRNFRSLSSAYDAEATYDFGGGYLLRKTATVKINADGLTAEYAITGTARVADIAAAEPYEEYLVPIQDGFLGIGLARWTTKDGNKIEAVVSTRYHLKGVNKADWSVVKAQIRRFSVDAKVNENGRVFIGEYKTNITAAKD